MDDFFAGSAFLRGFAQLFELGPEEADQLRPLEMEYSEVPARRTIVEEGRSYDFALIVRSGWLLEYKLLRNGKRQVLNFRLPGEIAAIDCLAYAKMPHSVAALSRSVVSRLPLKAFHEIQRRYPRLGSALFLMTLREEAILHQWEVSLGRRDATGRLAHLFLELHRRLQLRGLADSTSFELPAKQEDLADALGLTTPYVNRMLQAMRGDGLIELNGRAVILSDMKRLAQHAGFKGNYLDGWGSGTASQERRTPL